MIKRDVFIINGSAWLRDALKEAGVTSFDSSGVMGSIVTWYEEEGEDIRAAGLVVAIIDAGFFEDDLMTASVNVAVNFNKKILLLFEDEKYKKSFYEKWSRNLFAGEFGSRDMLFEAITEELYTNDTMSGSALKINFYIKSLLFDEALSECHTLVDKSRNDEFEHPVALLKRAEVYYLLENYTAFEEDVKKAIRAFKNIGVIWGSNNALYCERLLTEYYGLSGQTEKKNAAEEHIKGKRFFRAFDDGDKYEILYSQKIKLFFESASRRQNQFRQKKSFAAQNEDNATHKLIVNYIKASVDLFDKLSQKGVATGFDACLKESYERLAEYCRLINDSATEKLCADKIYDIDTGNCKFPIVKNADTSFDIKCLKTFLGKVVPDSKMFDVFISHKSEDIGLAENIYNLLQKKGKESFFDRISLPALGNAEYRSSILMAIDNSTHMIVVCSDLDYLKSTWVSQEYNMFCDELREGRKSGNILLVFTEEVCAEVYRTNKKCLPIQLRSFEIIPYNEIESKLIKYIC